MLNVKKTGPRVGSFKRWISSRIDTSQPRTGSRSFYSHPCFYNWPDFGSCSRDNKALYRAFSHSELESQVPTRKSPRLTFKPGGE